MRERIITRRLWRLGNRIANNAEVIRNASKPHHLSVVRKRYLRHLVELTKIKDRWSDTYKATRKRGRPDLRCPCPPPSHHWHFRRMAKGRRENGLLSSGYSLAFVRSLFR